MNEQTNAPLDMSAIVYVQVNISVFGGYARSTDDDIEDAGGRAPDTDVLTKGGKHIYPTEYLKSFGANKRNIFRQLSTIGVKAFPKTSVFAIPKAELGNAEAILDDGEEIHNGLAADFEAHYEERLQTFILGEKDEVQDVIRRSALTKESAMCKFKYSYTTFTPLPVGKNGSADGIQNSLVINLYNEIGYVARELYEKSMFPTDASSGAKTEKNIGQKTKRPIEAAMTKMQKFTFLHPGIQGGAVLIDYVLGKTQSSGFLFDEPSVLSKTYFVKLVELMAKPATFRDVAERITAGETNFERLLGMPGHVIVPQADIFVPDETMALILESQDQNAGEVEPAACAEVEASTEMAIAVVDKGETEAGEDLPVIEKPVVVQQAAERKVKALVTEFFF